VFRRKKAMQAHDLQDASRFVAADRPAAAARPDAPGLAVFTPARIAITFVVLMLVIAGMVRLVYAAQVRERRSVAAITALDAARAGEQIVIADFSEAVADVRFLAEESALQRLLAASDTAAAEAALRDIVEDYAALVRRKAIYEQVRYVDRAGREIVRLNWGSEGRAVVARPDQLRQAVNGPALTEALGLAPGQVYISSFGLKSDDGVVRRPLVPIVRFSAPVFDARGVLRGAVIVNYFGQPILDRIAAIETGTLEGLWLIDSDGFWLLGPSRESEWSFLLPERQGRSFASDHPEAWERIRFGPGQGHTEVAGSRFTHLRTRPDAGPERAAGSGIYPTFTLVAHASAEERAAMVAPMLRQSLLTLGAFGTLLASTALIAIRKAADHSRAEERRRAGEARFRAVAENANDGLINADSEGRITYFNAAAERMFGHSAADVLGRPLTMLMPERFAAAHEAALRRVAAGGERRILDTGRVDLIGRRRSGEEFPLELSLASATVERSLVFIGILRDITQRHEAERSIRDREARFRTLVEAAPDAVVIADKDGRIALVNAQTERLFGYSRDALVGQPVELLLPERFRDRHARHRADYAAEPRVRSMGDGLDLHGRRADGSEFPVAISLSPVETDAGTHVIAAVRDVTEQRTAERRIQKLYDQLTRDNIDLAVVNRELEAFSYSVSHDLRGPLRAIDGFSQALLEDCGASLDETGRDHLARVRRAAQRMGHLIDDLLKLSRVVRADLTEEKVDLSAIAATVIEGLQSEDLQRDVSVEIEAGLAARGDRRLLAIALQNLLGNAWKFTAGKEQATIAFGRTKQDGRTAFFVKDNGAGFDMAHADRLFRAFQRLHDSRSFPGSGIGLATVQRVIHKHGGRVWATAEEGRGATFYFALP
jgi:PAS domain S-box-containing protein